MAKSPVSPRMQPIWVRDGSGGDEPKAKSPVCPRMQPIWVRDGSGGSQTWEGIQRGAPYFQDMQYS